MKFVSSKLFAVAAMGLLSLSLQAQAACSPGDAIGRWGFSAQGTDLHAGGVQFTQVGAFVLKADGTGKGVVNHATVGMFLPNVPVTISGVSIDPVTCLGSGKIAHGPNPPVAHSFLLTNDGKELHIIDASGSHISLGVAKKL